MASWAREMVAKVRSGIVPRRDALYTLACALPLSPERSAILALLAESCIFEQERVRRAQETMDLTPSRRKAA
jgi:hypothetical protein